MKKKLSLLLSVAAILFSSCNVANTLYPISTDENDFIFKKELIGKWKEIKDSSGYIQVDTVAGKNKTLFLVTILSPDEENKAIIDTSCFMLRLIQLKKEYFLDCQLDISNTFPKNKGDYAQWLIARHFIIKISFDGKDKIYTSYPASDKLIQLIIGKKLSLNYSEINKNDYFILNNPSELQKALIESQKYPALYEDKDVFMRIK